MSVLHLISSLQVGGAEKLLLDLVREGAQSGKVSFVIVVMNDLVDEVMKRELLSIGCPVYLLNRPPSHRHPKYLLKLRSIIRNHNVQVIHSHTPGSKLWAVLCKLVHYRLKLVFTIHDTNIVPGFNRVHRFIHRRIIDRNVAISNAVLQECISMGLTNSTRIYNGIQLDKFITRTEPSHQDWRDRSIRIVNVARVTYKKKGQDILIEAIHKCREKGLNVSVSFIGGFYEYDRESEPFLKRMVDQYDLQNDITFYGNRNDVHALLPAFDLFVLPSRYEGLGLVVLEAMAAGLPVIASNIDGPSELITHGRNGYLFESGNADDLADAIIAMEQNQADRMKMVDQALADVQRFDIRVMLDRYLDLYAIRG